MAPVPLRGSISGIPMCSPGEGGRPPDSAPACRALQQWPPECCLSTNEQRPERRSRAGTRLLLVHAAVSWAAPRVLKLTRKGHSDSSQSGHWPGVSRPRGIGASLVRWPLSVHGVDWRDELAVSWSAAAAEALKARAVYSGCFVCEIVLEGACPRCGHPMVSTHPARGVTPPEAQDEPAPGDERERRRLLVLGCCCAHAHEGCPSDMQGCGAVFAVWVRWEDSRGPGTPHSRVIEPEAGPKPTLLALEQERALQLTKTAELADAAQGGRERRTGRARCSRSSSPRSSSRASNRSTRSAPPSWRFFWPLCW